MNVAVFCAGVDVAERYTAAAREFGALLAQHGHALIWGGSDVGTMKVVADAVQEGGGALYGVSVEKLKDKARVNADEMYIAKDWPERKERMLARADAVVIMPGGIGTLDEATDVLEKKKHDVYQHPIIFLNTDGFYDGLAQQLERMDREGFLPRTLAEYVAFVDTPADALRALHSTTH